MTDECFEFRFGNGNEIVFFVSVLTDAFAIGRTNDFRFVAFAIVLQTTGALAIATFCVPSQGVALIARFSYFWSVEIK